jgi:hypothetical protein
VYTHLSRTPFRHCFTWLLYVPPSFWKPLSFCSLRARSRETAGPAVLWLSICWRPHYAKYSNGLKRSLISHKRVIRNWRTRSLCVGKWVDDICTLRVEGHISTAWNRKCEVDCNSSLPDGPLWTKVLYGFFSFFILPVLRAGIAQSI